MATSKKQTSTGHAKKTNAPSKSQKAIQRQTPGDGVANLGGENLDKVRDILFGSQMRDNERRFARMEEKLAKELNDLREDTRKHLDALNVFVRKETQSLIERLKAEQTSRSEAIKAVGQDIKSEAGERTDAIKAVLADLREAVKSIAEQIQSHAEKIEESQHALRQEILDQSRNLRDELDRANSAMTSATLQAADELRSDKADRSALAEVFAEMSIRLKGDIEPQ